MSTLKKTITHFQKILQQRPSTPIDARDSTYTIESITNESSRVIHIKIENNTGTHQAMLTFFPPSSELYFCCNACECSALDTISNRFHALSKLPCSHISDITSLILRSFSSQSDVVSHLMDKVQSDALKNWVRIYMTKHRSAKIHFQIYFADLLFEYNHEKEIRSLIRRLYSFYSIALVTKKTVSKKSLEYFQKLLQYAIIAQRNKEFLVSWTIGYAMLQQTLQLQKDKELNLDGILILKDIIAVLNALKSPKLPIPVQLTIKHSLKDLFLDPQYCILSQDVHFLPILEFCTKNKVEFYATINEKLMKSRHVQTTTGLMKELLIRSQHSSIAAETFQNNIHHLNIIIWESFLKQIETDKIQFLKTVLCGKIETIGSNPYDLELLKTKYEIYKESNIQQAYQSAMRIFDIAFNEAIFSELVERKDALSHEQISELVQFSKTEMSPLKRLPYLENLNATEELYKELKETSNATIIARYIHNYKGERLQELKNKFQSLVKDYLENHIGPASKAYCKQLISILSVHHNSHIIFSLFAELEEEFSHRISLSAYI